MRRPQVGRVASAPLVALVVCGLLAGGGIAASSSGGLQPADVTATSATDWWVLATVRCGSGQCLAIRRTQNGGRSFSILRTPPSSTAERTTVSQLSFADARDGYAYGPELWSTHDGGRNWRQLRIGYSDDVTTAGGYAYALVSDRGGTQLMRSPVVADRWQTLQVPGLAVLGGLWVQGRTVVVQGRTRVLVSSDHGAHFRQGGRLPAGTSCQFDAAVRSRVLWALCFRAVAGSGGAIIRSSNGGSTWSRVSLSGVPHGPVQALAAASGTVAVIAGYQRLYRTTDAGAHWSRVTGLPAGFYETELRFIDPTHGTVIGGTGSGRRFRTVLYSTSDAGASYHRVALR